MKKCRRCGELKPFDSFTKSPSNKDGYATLCKACCVLKNREYYQTPKGRITYIFGIERNSSKARNHEMPAYTKEELYEWAIQHGLLALVDTWKASGYSKEQAPSVDRLDPTQPYSLENIRLVPWKDNNDKAYEDRKSCRHITKQNRGVRQYSSEGRLVAEYGSISQAARLTGITRININDVCRKKPHCKSAGGFFWEYANQGNT